MQREFIALGGATDEKSVKPPIGGSAYLIRVGNAGLLIDAGLYPQPEKVLRDYAERIIKIEFELIGSKKLPILPKSCLLDDADFIPASAKEQLPNFDILKELKELYVVLTHSHADHAGAMPFLKRICPHAHVMMTQATLDLCSWSWNDYLSFMRRRKQQPIYTNADIARLLSQISVINVGERKSFGPFELAFFHAGHILGAISVLAKVDGTPPTSFFFASDISFHDQHTVNGAPHLFGSILGGVDYLVTEATYAGRNAPGRANTERTLVEDVEACLAKGGKALLPVLSIGRAAEVASILHQYGIMGRYPVYVDGAARETIGIYIKNGALDSHAAGIFVHNKYDRLTVANSPGPAVILAPAGMVTGGNAIYYCQRLANDEKNLIGLTCYQAKYTPGYSLLRLPRGQKIQLDRECVALNAEVKQYHLSAHATDADLAAMIARINPSRSTFLVHGEPEGMRSLMDSLPGKAVCPALLGKIFNF